MSMILIQCLFSSHDVIIIWSHHYIAEIPPIRSNSNSKHRNPKNIDWYIFNWNFKISQGELSSVVKVMFSAWINSKANGIQMINYSTIRKKVLHFLFTLQMLLWCTYLFKKWTPAFENDPLILTSKSQNDPQLFNFWKKPWGMNQRSHSAFCLNYYYLCHGVMKIQYLTQWQYWSVPTFISKPGP